MRSCAAIMLGLALLTAPALAQTAASETAPVRIGVLTDMSGMNATGSGSGSVLAAKLAVADFGPSLLGRQIEILSADHQNKPDVGAAIARRWYDTDGVDVIVDVPNSAVAYAVAELARRKDRLVIFSTAGASDLTGVHCTANSFQWSYSTYAVARASVASLMQQAGKAWFFLAADYAGSIAMARDAEQLLRAAGGAAVGSVRAPIGTTDFGPYLLQAQAAGASVLMVMNSGSDQANTLKQAHEFGLDRAGIRLASTFNEAYVLESLGPEASAGYLFATSWYWDLNDATRAFSARFFAAAGMQPSMMQAGVYSAVLSWLKAARDARATAAGTVAAALRARPVDDMFTEGGQVRTDGSMAHDMFLMRGKGPTEKRRPWDVAEVVSRVPATTIYPPMSESACPLVRGAK